MKKFSKAICILLAVCTVLSILLAFTACSQSPIKNLIYVIGDGMGFNHIENAKLFMDAEKLAFEEYYVGEVTTHSADNDVTDSAAAATALATGVKTNNDYVGISPFGKELQNVMELSKKNRKKTAIVTTDILSGATPAGFSAHVESRIDAYEIVLDQAQCTVDLFMGLFSSGYRVYQDEFVSNGYAYVESMEELATVSKDSQIVANISNVDSAHNPQLTDVVPLKTLVEYALDYLTTDNKKGFTLMVEGAYIDKHSHNHDIMLMIYALMDLNEAVEYILDWASKRDDTAVIFTADHETCGLRKATDKNALSNSLYSATYHTSLNVPLYLYNISTDKNIFDNVDIYQLAKQIAQN